MRVIPRARASFWRSASCVLLPSTTAAHVFAYVGSRASASRNASARTSSGGCARLAHTRLCSGRGRRASSAARTGASRRPTSSGVRTQGAMVSTAATVASRLAWRFSPLERRVASLCVRCAAAVRVGSRRSAGRMTTPLPSAVRTSTAPVGPRAAAVAWRPA